MKHFLFCLTIITAFQLPLHAYADPGSGALLLQLILAGCVGLLFYARQGWSWIRSKFGRNGKSSDTANNE